MTGDLPSQPKATVLVVDDEAAVRRVLVMRLQLSGYRVICAEDGEQALEMFHNESPDLVVDTNRRQVTRGSERINLTYTEFSLLELLFRDPGHVVPRAEILEQLWGYPPRRAADLRVVDVYVARLRGKLEPDPRNPELILTVRGIGYASQRMGEASAAG